MKDQSLIWNYAATLGMRPAFQLDDQCTIALTGHQKAKSLRTFSKVLDFGKVTK